MTSETGLGRKPVNTGPLLKYLSENLGLPVHMDDIMKATKLSKQQVQSSMYHLRNRKGMDIETIVAGQVFRLKNYSTPKTTEGTPQSTRRSTKRIFEEIGTTKQGVIVAQDEDGALYKVEEL